MKNCKLDTLLLIMNIVLSLSLIEKELKKLESQITRMKYSKYWMLSVVRSKKNIEHIMSLIEETQIIINNSIRLIDNYKSNQGIGELTKD